MNNIYFYKKDDINHNNWYTKFKYIFMMPIAFLRFSVLISAFGITYLLKIFPQYYNIISKITSYMFLFGFGVYPIEIKNKYLIKDGIKNNAIMIYNHISIADVFVIYLLYPFAIVINELYGKRLKHIIDACDGIILEKHELVYRRQTQKIIDHINSKKRCLIIAPEGKVTNGKYLATFKRGAFAPLKPVQPILLKYNYTYCNPFFSEDNVLIVLYRMLTQFITFVNVTVLPVQYPKNNETVDEYTERIRTIMADELHVQKV